MLMGNICFSCSFNQKTRTLALSVALSLKEMKYPFYITFFLFHKHMNECIWKARCAEEFLIRNLVHTVVRLSTLHIGVPLKELEKQHFIEDLSTRHLTQPSQFTDRETEVKVWGDLPKIITLVSNRAGSGNHISFFVGHCSWPCTILPALLGQAMSG